MIGAGIPNATETLLDILRELLAHQPHWVDAEGGLGSRVGRGVVALGEDGVQHVLRSGDVEALRQHFSGLAQVGRLHDVVVTAGPVRALQLHLHVGIEVVVVLAHPEDLGDVLLALGAALLDGDHVTEVLRPEPVHVGDREGLALLHLDLDVRLAEVVGVGQAEVAESAAGEGRNPLAPDVLARAGPGGADVEDVGLEAPGLRRRARGDVGHGGGVLVVGHHRHVVGSVALADVVQVPLLAVPVKQAATGQGE